MTHGWAPIQVGVWAAPVITLGTWIAAFSPPLATDMTLTDVIWAVPFTVFAVVGAIVLAHQHTNRIGWILSGIGLMMGLAALELGVLRGLNSFPGGHGLAAWLVIVQPFGPIGYGLIVMLLLTFPDGRLPTRRWRLLVAALCVFLILVVIEQAVNTQPVADGLPVSVLANASAAAILGPMTSFNLNGILLLLAGCGLVSRYRSAGAVGRLQIKWFAVATVVLVGCAVAGGLADAVAHRGDVRAELQSTGLVCFASGIGLAVVKHHLYDVDLIISRALSYTALVGMVTLIYIGLVVGVGSLVGRTTGANLVLSVAATAVIAVVFHPFQAMLQDAANRLVFGRRQTPYEALTSFTRQLATSYAAGNLMQQMADALAQGVRAQAAGVYLINSSEPIPIASSPQGTGVPPTAPQHSMPVTHHGERLGTLTVWTQPGLALNPTEQRLLTDLAVQAGLLLHNARLTVELEHRIQELRASRRRLVTAQDAERRRLERDLHDGAQHDLVALRMKLGLAEREATPTSARLASLLAELRQETGLALENIRRLSRGLYPPLLESQGLTAALTAHARRLPIPVEVLGGPQRFSREIETAVYFCCVEALQNTIKHAHAHQARIRIRHTARCLHLSIQDDGHGFDPQAHRTGAGLQNLTDRIEALTGTLSIASNGTGTKITADIPAGPHATP
jgi:signal transduction histidine kinase